MYYIPSTYFLPKNTNLTPLFLLQHHAFLAELSRAFSKIDHSGSATRILLEQNKFSKKLPLTSIEPRTLGLW